MLQDNYPAAWLLTKVWRNPATAAVVPAALADWRPRFRRPIAHAWRIIRFRELALESLGLVIAFMIGHETEIKVGAAGSSRRIIIGVDRRPAAPEDRLGARRSQRAGHDK